VKLAQLGEFGLIERIASLVPQRADVATGIGDDAAVTSWEPGLAQLTTTDMLVEGVHFDRSFTPPRLLGRKSLSVNLSDIAAMGGAPRHCYLGLALPATAEVEFVEELVKGFLEVAAEHSVILAGGDTCASPAGLVIAVTVVGEQLPQRVVRRSGAHPGDSVLVTGFVGDAALGLRLLQQGVRDGEPVRRHLSPSPRLREGQLLSGEASAMIDVSDGLLADLGHICRQSGVGARLERDLIPLSPELREVLGRGDQTGWELALAGGEDYELLFTVPPERLGRVMEALAREGAGATVIGEITGDGGIVLVGPDGGALPLDGEGFDHFRLPGELMSP
jgi:thiamine-monophosphate kinase